MGYRAHMVRFLALLWVATACTRSPAPATATGATAITPRTPEIPLSDPAEYAIDRISRDAGKAIFERTGVGDPYRTGVPYPVFLALQRAYPAILGNDPQDLAARFGFVARAADPASEDLDRREGLPIGLHLTTDPLTGVQFLMTACAACHAEHLRWAGGDAVVIGLGNKRIRIHAYDRAFAQVTREPGFTAARLAAFATDAAAARHLAWPEPYREGITAATVRALGVRRDRSAPSSTSARATILLAASRRSRASRSCSPSSPARRSTPRSTSAGPRSRT